MIAPDLTLPTLNSTATVLPPPTVTAGMVAPFGPVSSKACAAGFSGSP
jgi:hypothetical protein